VRQARVNDPIPRSGRPDRQVVRPPYVHPWPETIRPRELPPDMETTVLATDIMGFGRSYRDPAAQLYARQLMYDLLIEAFDMTALPWWDCHREDRGDGVLVVATPELPPDQFLDPLIHHLNALLRAHARHGVQVAPLRVRLAVHHGYVYYDAHGVTGDALTYLYRLLEASAFKRAVDSAGARLGVIVSDQLYSQAIARDTLINPAAYTQLRLNCKETRTRGWLWLPAESRPLQPA